MDKDKNREEMKNKINGNFDRKAYEKRLLESLKKANGANSATQYHRSGDRGGR